jgi:hypothetical protein
MLAVSITLTAQLKPSEQERQMVQRLQEAQMNGSDSDYYKAQEAFMDYLEKNNEWDKYYRTWMGRVIYEVNHKRFHRAFGEINFITDDIKQRHHEQYAYIANMCLGFFYNGRNQQDMAEKCFRRALQGIDVQKDPISVFNVYLSLSQTLSFNRPAEAMACLDSLPNRCCRTPCTRAACWVIAVSLPTKWAIEKPLSVISKDMTASASICLPSSMLPIFIR